VVLATSVMSFPLLVRSALTAFEEVDPRLVGLARTLGCGAVGAFFRVTLPLAWRGVLAGTVLAFARALGEFGAVVLIAGNIPFKTEVASVYIFQHVSSDDPAGAAALAVLLLVISLGVLLAIGGLRRWFTRHDR
jgi:molybdate transport system permease protein